MTPPPDLLPLSRPPVTYTPVTHTPVAYIPVAYILYIYVGLAWVDNGAVKNANHCVKLHNPGCLFFFFFFGGHRGWRISLTLHRGNDGITQCDSVYVVRHPRGSYISVTIAVSRSGHAGKQMKSFDAVIRIPESTPHKRFLVGCSSPLMRLAEHLTFRFALGASNVCMLNENPKFSVPALQGCEGLWSYDYCLLYTSPSPRDRQKSRMPSSA